MSRMNYAIMSHYAFSSICVREPRDLNARASEVENHGSCPNQFRAIHNAPTPCIMPKVLSNCNIQTEKKNRIPPVRIALRGYATR